MKQKLLQWNFPIFYVIVIVFLHFGSLLRRATDWGTQCVLGTVLMLYSFPFGYGYFYCDYRNYSTWFVIVKVLYRSVNNGDFVSLCYVFV